MNYLFISYIAQATRPLKENVITADTYFIASSSPSPTKIRISIYISLTELDQYVAAITLLKNSLINKGFPLNYKS